MSDWERPAALWRASGQVLVLEWANEAFLRRTPGVTCGMPMAETSGPTTAYLAEAVRRVYLAGHSECHDLVSYSGRGRFWLAPRIADGRIVGVATCWEPVEKPDETAVPGLRPSIFAA